MPVLECFEFLLSFAGVVGDGSADGVDVFGELGRCDPDDHDAGAIHPSISLRVVALLIEMIPAIDLDHKACFRAVEVRDIVSDRCLVTKAEVCQLSTFE